MRRYINILLWMTGFVIVVLMLVFVSKRQQNLACKHIEVEFKNDFGNNQYVDNEYIYNLIRADSIIGKPLSKANISKLEQKLNNDSYIENAEVYKKINGTLNVEVSQRMPIVRIINSYNISYYIGKEGILMPISNKLSKRILVANGNISYLPVFDTLVNIYARQFDKDSNMIVLRNIHKLTNFFNADKFWQAQIQQIYITNNKEIELIPLVGSHIIELGGIEMYEEKLRKLKIMYKKGFSSLGWNNYKTISLKYNNQVVCKKSG